MSGETPTKATQPGAGGEPLEDATPVWSTEALHFLLEASEELASSLAYEHTLARVAELAVPRVADWCAVEVLGAEGSLKRLAVAHVDPAKVELAYELTRRFPTNPDEGLMTKVLRTGQAEFIPEIPDEMLKESARNAEHYALLQQLGLRSAIVAPMIARGRTIGALTFVASEPERHYTDSDLELAQELARRAAIAVDNAWLYETAQRELAEREASQHQLQALSAELEERVAKRTAQLERANKELEAFSYSVSHDLRAPLRSIDGFSRILLEDYQAQLDDDGRDFLNRIRQSAQQMGQLIDDLLAFSRLSRQQLNMQRIDMTKLVHQVIQELHADAEHRQIEWQVDDLPPCRADPSLVKQVLANLLANALKFTRKRDVACIHMGSERQENDLVYFIKDNGAGFDMRFANKLFGVFQRLHLAEEYEGTGVGLAIVQRVVARHGGRVWAEGEVERGASFYFTLPDGQGGTDDGQRS